MTGNSVQISHYRPQRSWAKVMFLQASVILSTGGDWGGSASVHAGIPPGTRPPQEQTPLEQTPPGTRPLEQTPPLGPDPLGPDPPQEQTPPGPDPPGADTPPESRLWHTVNERPVRILLECILDAFLLLTVGWHQKHQNKYQICFGIDP